MPVGDAEVMTTAIVAAGVYRGNSETARNYLRKPKFLPAMLGKNRFNLRLHHLREVFLTLFGVSGETWKALNVESIHAYTDYPADSGEYGRRDSLPRETAPRHADSPQYSR